jgi:hypothetical protein
MATYNLPNTISNGDTPDATVLMGNFDYIENTLNDHDGANITDATITDAKLVNDPTSMRDETIQNGVVSGLTTADPGATLTAVIAAGVAYIEGVRVAVNSYSNAYTASKDCYVDLDKNGTFTVIEVANAATSPALTTNSIRVAKFVTNGSEVTSAVQTGLDSLGNRIRPMVNTYTISSLYNPYRFNAYRGSNVNLTSAQWTTIVFDTEAFDTNSNYNTSTGGYTAPVTGYYQFNFSVDGKCGTGGTTVVGAELYMPDGTTPIYAIIRSDGGGLEDIGVTGSQIVYLTAGQTVYVRVYVTGVGQSVIQTAGRITSFSGFLVSL